MNYGKCPYLNKNREPKDSTFSKPREIQKPYGVYGSRCSTSGSFTSRKQDSDGQLKLELAIVTNRDNALKVRYIPAKPTVAPPDLGLPIPPDPPQYEAGAVYPWSSIVIPDNINESVAGTPNEDGYCKLRSVHDSVGFFLGNDMETLEPTSKFLSLFLTNLEDRGTDDKGRDNYRKMVYMSAITCDRLPYYDEKMNTFLNEVYADITTYGRPVLSSFRKALIRFFLAVHIGYDDYPENVIEYFNLFVNIIGFGDLDRPGHAEAMLAGRKLVPEVRDYFKARSTVVKETQDRTSMVYYWSLAGLDSDGLVMEGVHNIIAFSQFNHLMYLIINDQFGKGTQLPPFLPQSYDFFDKFNAAGSNILKLNIIREIYRLLVPNGVSFSRVKQAVPDAPATTIQNRLVHKLLMINNTPGPAGTYFFYNPLQYTGYNTDFSECVCPMDFNDPPLIAQPPNPDGYNPSDRFDIDATDSETLQDVCNPKMVPVFNTLRYAPFGLGYRRCPGETFTYYFTWKMLAKFKDLQFEFQTVDVSNPPDIITLAPFTSAFDNIYTV